jgi:ABC-type multidrug transport system ATPase subunit
LTWFITASLRRAHAYESYFEKGTHLRLNIQRVVKIYDERGRFIREWNKGKRIAEHRDLRNYRFTRKDFGHYTWQIPLLGFLIYFIYFYVESQMWLFILSLLLYGFLYSMLQPIIKFCAVHYAQSQSRKWNVMKAAVFGTLIWGFPAASLGIFHMYFFETRIILFIGIAWYGSLVYMTISRALRSKAVEYKQMSGRLARMKQSLLWFVRLLFFARTKSAPFKALSPISLQIENGMFGLLGPNGAGKTTLMRILCGILNMSHGVASINDIDLTEKREELQGLIGFMPQEFGFYENMTAGEFLDYIALLKSIFDYEKRESAIENSLKSVHLDEYRNWKIKTFSGGMKQRLGIAMTLLNLPKILIVDEPTAGLDPRERIRFRNLLVELSRERIVVFSTHIIEDISSSCNQVAVLDKGELYYAGDPPKMTAAANGKIWQFFTDFDTFEHLQNTLWIVHHMRVNDKIRIRCISEEPPAPDAVQVEPTMEDAYLWLLGKNQAPHIEMISENEQQTVG